MTITKQSSLIKTSLKPPETSLEKRVEAERIHDILILLQNLVNSEEATVKLILHCLYDVGSVNLINQKLRPRQLNRVTKLIARMSKPIFITFAYIWFKKNCPQLITNWLHLQVTFKNPQDSLQQVAVEVVKLQPDPILQIENYNREIKHLRSRVRWLTGFSIMAIAALSVTLTWQNLSSQMAQSDFHKKNISTFIQSINK